MNTRTRTKIGMLAAIAVLGFAVPVLAQPHKEDHHEPKADEHHDAKGDDHHDGKGDEHKHHAAEAASAAGAEAPSAGAASAAPAASAGGPADSKVWERLRRFEAKRQRDRQAALKDPKAWDEGRPGRAAEHRSEIAAAWGKAVAAPDAQAELKKHAERMAKLNRILDLANEKNDTALAARVQADIQTETERDAQAMQAIQAKAGAK